MPSWVWTIELARWQGCDPWDLEAAPAQWLERIRAVKEGREWFEAESAAQAAAAARNRR